MHSERTPAPLLHIRENILLAQQFVGEMSYEAFCADLRTVYAVIRCLEIVSEASRRVDRDTKARYPELPWLDMAGAGNIYRHDYERVREALVWATVKESLPGLLRIVEGELKRQGK